MSNAVLETRQRLDLRIQRVNTVEKKVFFFFIVCGRYPDKVRRGSITGVKAEDWIDPAYWIKQKPRGSGR